MSDSSDDEPEDCDVTQERIVTSQAEEDLSLHVGLDVHNGVRSDGPYKLMEDQIIIPGLFIVFSYFLIIKFKKYS